MCYMFVMCGNLTILATSCVSVVLKCTRMCLELDEVKIGPYCGY